jgi:hypothetical protein
MIFKKDNFLLGCILGLLAPVIGVVLFKYYKLQGSSFGDMVDYMIHQSDGHRLLSAALSVSIILDLALLTIYLNIKNDKTAKGIFVSTVLYAAVILLLKTFG